MVLVDLAPPPPPVPRDVEEQGSELATFLYIGRRFTVDLVAIWSKSTESGRGSARYY